MSSPKGAMLSRLFSPKLSSGAMALQTVAAPAGGGLLAIRPAMHYQEGHQRFALETAMAASFEIRLKVPFHDLDPLRIVWHGHYMKYFDMARFGLFEACGIDLYRWMSEDNYVFPVTRTAVKHIAPLGPNEAFVCRATVTEAAYKIVMQFEIRRLPGGELCTRASSEQVAVRLPDMALEFEIPAAIRRALENAP